MRSQWRQKARSAEHAKRHSADEEWESKRRRTLGRGDGESERHTSEREILPLLPAQCPEAGFSVVDRSRVHGERLACSSFLRHP